MTRRQVGEDRYPAFCELLATFPRLVELPEVTVVHGFWEPGKAAADQMDTVLGGTLTGEKLLKRKLGRPWYELYDGPKPLVVGHHDHLGNGRPLIWRERVWGLDTSCCRGGRLTALLLPDFQIVSVPSRADYWARALREDGGGPVTSGSR